MRAALSQKDLGALLDLLSNDTRPIEAVGALFLRTFAKADHFRMATALCLLIQDGVLNLSQRILAFFILFDLYKAPRPAPCASPRALPQRLTRSARALQAEAPGTNPFLPVLLEQIGRPGLDSCERHFLLPLVSPRSPPRPARPPPGAARGADARPLRRHCRCATRPRSSRRSRRAT